MNNNMAILVRTFDTHHVVELNGWHITSHADTPTEAVQEAIDTLAWESKPTVVTHGTTFNNDTIVIVTGGVAE